MREYIVRPSKALGREETSEITELIASKGEPSAIRWHDKGNAFTVIADEQVMSDISDRYGIDEFYSNYLIRYTEGHEIDENTRHSREDLVKGYGITHLGWVPFSGLHLVQARKKDIETLEELPIVQYIDMDEIAAPDSQLIEYDMQVTKTLAHGHNTGYSGQGVSVCIVDNGLLFTHEDLPNPAKAMWAVGDSEYEYYDSAVDGPIPPTGIIGPVDHCPPEECGYYCEHGTAVSGVVFMQNNDVGGLGAAPGATMMHANAAKHTLGSAGVISIINTTRLLAGIYWAIASGADIVSLSYGFQNFPSALRDAAAYAKENGVHLCLSAGNNGDSAEYNSALNGTDDAVTVGAVREYPSAPSGVIRQHYSGVGPYLDFMAPTDFRTTSGYGNDKYRLAAGTSSATPFIAGMIAVLRQAYPRFNAETGPGYWNRIYSILKNNCIVVGDGDPLYHGHGLPVMPDLSVKELDPSMPNIEALPPTNITLASARLNAEVHSLGDTDELWVLLMFKEDLGAYEPFIAATWPESEYEGYPEYPTSGEGFWNLVRHNFVEHRRAVKITSPGLVSVDISGLSPEANYLCTVLGYHQKPDGTVWIQFCNRYSIEEHGYGLSEDEVMEAVALSFTAEGELEEPINNDPAVNTLPASNIGITSVVIGGEITNIGIDYPTRYLQWGLTPNTMHNHVNLGVGGLGVYSAEVNLLPETTYYFRAYATNPWGTDYGETMEFTTSPAFYLVKRQIGEGSWQDYAYTTDVNTYDDQGPFPEGVPYHYQVQDLETGIISNIASVMWQETKFLSIMGNVPFNRFQSIHPDGDPYGTRSRIRTLSQLGINVRKYIPDSTESYFSAYSNLLIAHRKTAQFQFSDKSTSALNIDVHSPVRAVVTVLQSESVLHTAHHKYVPYATDTRIRAISRLKSTFRKTEPNILPGHRLGVDFNRFYYSEIAYHVQTTSTLISVFRKYVPDATETKDSARSRFKLVARKLEEHGWRLNTRFNRFDLKPLASIFQTRSVFSLGHRKTIRYTAELVTTSLISAETRFTEIPVSDRILRAYVVPVINQAGMKQPALPPISMPRDRNNLVRMQVIDLSTNKPFELLERHVEFHVKPSRYDQTELIVKTTDSGVKVSAHGLMAVEFERLDLQMRPTDYTYGITITDGDKVYRLSLGLFRLLP